MALTRADLDTMRCANGCDDHPLFLHARCHMDADLTVAYDRETGTLIVQCAVCDKTTAVIAVEKGRRK